MSQPTFETLGYQTEKNLIDTSQATLLATEFSLLRDNLFWANNVPIDSVGLFNDGQVEKSFSWYGFFGFESLLTMVQPKIEKIVGKQLFPTYSYARIYYPGAVMEAHVDRPSCEYSVTLTISHDPENPWPIYFSDLQGTETPLTLNIGDGCVYKGDVLTHWRNEYTGRKQIQAFLHYVDANGQFVNHKFDKRPMLGLPAQTKKQD